MSDAVRNRSLFPAVQPLIGQSDVHAPPTISAVDRILFEREVRGLLVPVLGRIALGLIGITSLLYTTHATLELGLDLTALYLFLAVMAVGTGLNLYFLYLLRVGRHVGVVGFLGAGVDVLVIAASFGLTLHFSRFIGLSPGAIFKSELPLTFTAFVVVNGLALRPAYPLIVGVAATMALMATAIYAALDPVTVFSSELHQTMSGPALDAPQLVTTVLFVAGVTAAVTSITAAVRRTIRRGIATELENARLQREQLKVVMREKVEALGRLVAGVSHEINNPLGVAKSGIDTQRRALQKIDGELPPTSQKGHRAVTAATSVLDSVAEALGRIEATEQSLRAFAHLDEGDFQRVRLADEIDATVSMLDPDLNAPRRLTLAVSPQLPELFVRAREINQMLMALLRRALESDPEHAGEVRVEAESAGDAVVVRISDAGPGIEEATRRQLFDVNLRSQGRRVAADFDLPTAQAIAHRHGGDITAVSELGRGTTFTVRLPIGAAAGPPSG
jgi:signal transduction histidine kinase